MSLAAIQMLEERVYPGSAGGDVASASSLGPSQTSGSGLCPFIHTHAHVAFHSCSLPLSCWARQAVLAKPPLAREDRPLYKDRLGCRVLWRPGTVSGRAGTLHFPRQPGSRHMPCRGPGSSCAGAARVQDMTATVCAGSSFQQSYAQLLGPTFLQHFVLPLVVTSSGFQCCCLWHPYSHGSLTHNSLGCCPSSPHTSQQWVLPHKNTGVQEDS